MTTSLEVLGHRIRADVDALIAAEIDRRRYLGLQKHAEGREPDRSTPERRSDETIDVAAAVAYRGQPDGLPVTGTVSSPFGMRPDPFGSAHPEMHFGVDIAAPEGSPVRATADGVVRRVGQAGAYGNLVEIEHEGGFTTRYAHLAAIGVEQGTKVHRGDTIGSVGHTGRATGPHLHYEVRREGKPVSPGVPGRRHDPH